jgi:hypothetical protein
MCEEGAYSFHNEKQKHLFPSDSRGYLPDPYGLFLFFGKHFIASCSAITASSSWPVLKSRRTCFSKFFFSFRIIFFDFFVLQSRLFKLEFFLDVELNPEKVYDNRQEVNVQPVNVDV